MHRTVVVNQRVSSLFSKSTQLVYQIWMTKYVIRRLEKQREILSIISESALSGTHLTCYSGKKREGHGESNLTQPSEGLDEKRTDLALMSNWL